VLGFAILFAVAMTARTLYQVNVVPEKNEQVEFEHTQDVARDMATLQDQLQAAGTTGAPQRATVRLGLRYPQRTVGVNAPHPRGRLATTGPEQVVVENAVATGEAGDYWDGSARTFDTRHLTYAPSYNYRDRDPSFRLEPGLLARQVDGGTVVESGSGPVTGSRIDLVTVAGEYSESGRSKSVELVPVSGGGAYRTVTDDGGPITLTIPTALPASAWQRALGDEPYVARVDHRGDRVVVELQEDRSYRLRVLRAGVGADADPTGRYLTGEPTARSVPEGGRETLTVTAHDRYGNPVAGATVNARVVGDGSLDSDRVTTGTDGRATFTFSPGSTGTDAQVLASIGGGVTDERRVRFDIDVAGGGGGGGEGDGEGDGGGGDEGDTAGVGSRTDYGVQQSVTVAKSDGRWEHVDSLDSIYLSEGRFRRVDPTTNTVALKLNFYVQDPDTGDYRTVNVELKPPSSPGGEWQAKKVKIEGPDQTYLNDAPLTDAAANKIVGRNGRSARVDLLDNSNYEPRANPTPRLTTAEKQGIRTVASDDSFVYFRTISQGIIDVGIE
jgi:hypothetical protein